MNIKKIIEGKKEWRAHVSRVKSLPEDYQIVYKEIQKYLFKVGPVELGEGIGLLSEILTFFEEGVATGKSVLEVTGTDVAAFSDALIEDSKTYADLYQESVKKKLIKRSNYIEFSGYFILHSHEERDTPFYCFSEIMAIKISF
ncbi:hypothetical protein BN988_02258 [Oceanobacillus picturae]|uniref:DUF1048 domain-containing protein n=1 Tax=Oceanobacillus picturae TaxID=171693 RepID=W9BBE8_9BACI|nr:hypothetical protein BN988_02258 [Oceanobacillus picturae]